MTKYLVLLALAIALLIPFQSSPVFAYNQPAINLGFTSFLDGGPPAGPGFYFTEYLQFYTADDFADLPIPGQEVDVWVSLNQFIYQSDQPVLFGGKWGIDLIIPIVSFDSTILPDNGTGLGDLLVGPYLQWDMKMGANGPLFVHRIELQTILPTGKYDQNKALNPGSNFISFDPYWAATLFITPRLTTSWRLHYLWNAENDDTNTQAGQAFHANFSVAYEVIPKTLRLGINGYYLKQFTRTQVNGSDVSDKEKVFGIGPGALIHLGKDNHIFINAYFETATEYRPEGERYQARWVHHF
ncbi:MAG: transporter [Desulfuromusa sp.]